MNLVHQVRIGIAVAITISLLASCTNSDNQQSVMSSTTSARAPSIPSGAEVTGIATSATADASGRLNIDIGGVGSVRSMTGSLKPGATVSVQAVRLKKYPATVKGIRITSPPTGIAIAVDDRSVLAPLVISFRIQKLPRRTSPVAVHVDDTGAWETLPGTFDNEILSVKSSSFSTIGWVADEVLKPIGDFLAEEFAGRTSPPKCEAQPAWASVTTAASGSTHACIRNGKAQNGTPPIAELEIKSNRGEYQWIRLSNKLPREYLWVSDQPDWLRSVIAKKFGTDDILLAPGSRMTIGYRQPIAPEQLRFHGLVDTRLIFLSMFKELIDFSTDKTIDSVGAWLVAFHCSESLNINFIDFRQPVRSTWPDALSAFATCSLKVVEELANPTKAATIAGQQFGPGPDTDALTKRAQQLFKLGAGAKKLQLVLLLGSYVLKELTFIIDALIEHAGSNASDAVLDLTALPQPVAKPTGCEGLDLSILPDTMVGFAPAVCSYPWAIVEFSEIQLRDSVALIKTTGYPPELVHIWQYIEDGPGVSGYTLASLKSYGVPADVARLLFNATQ